MPGRAAARSRGPNPRRSRAPARNPWEKTSDSRTSECSCSRWSGASRSRIRRKLALVGVHDPHLRCWQPGGGNVEHVGAVLGQRPRVRWSGQDACQVQDANTGQRRASGRQWFGVRLADFHHLDARHVCECPTLRMGRPLRGGARHRAALPIRGERILELLRIPTRDGGGSASRSREQSSTARVPAARCGKLPCKWTQRPSRHWYRSTSGLPSAHEGGGGPSFRRITSDARNDTPALRTLTLTSW